MTVLLVIQVIITVALVGSILLQRSGADGLAGIGGGGGNFMSGRGAANALTKTTAILATLFIVNSLILAINSSHTKRETSIIEKIESQNMAPATTQDAGAKTAEEVKQELEQTEQPAEKPAVPFAQ